MEGPIPDSMRRTKRQRSFNNRPSSFTKSEHPVAFKFNEGYSNAVKRTVYVRDLISRR